MTQKDKWEVSNWFLTPNEPQRSYTFISYHYKSVMMKLRKIQNLELNTAVMCVYIKKKGKHNRCWKQTNCLWSLLLTVLTNNTISLLLTELINNTNRREEKKRSRRQGLFAVRHSCNMSCCVRLALLTSRSAAYFAPWAIHLYHLFPTTKLFSFFLQFQWVWLVINSESNFCIFPSHHLPFVPYPLTPHQCSQ